MPGKGKSPRPPKGKRISPDDSFIPKISGDRDGWIVSVEKKNVHGQLIDVKICKPGSTVNPISMGSLLGGASSATNSGDLYASKSINMFGSTEKKS